MRLLLLTILVSLLFACSKNNNADQPQGVLDTLSSGWKKIQLPTSKTVIDIFFINNNTGFAIAGDAIFRSTDGGNVWKKVYDAANPLSNIGMGNSTNAIFTSTSKIFITTDGGASFDSIQLADPNIQDAFFVSESVAYVAGQNTWKTVNSGDSWTKLSSFAGTQGGDLRTLYFLNEQTGWVTGHGLFKTLDGGITWTSIPPPIGLTFGGLGTICFMDNDTGYVTDAGSVNKTLNGGSNFTMVFSTNRHVYHDISFVSKQTGYLTDDKHIFKTTDSGQNWTSEVALKNIQLFELHFTDASHGWAGGEQGLILKYVK